MAIATWHDESMTHKKSKKDADIRATLADIAKEMAKPRVAESARKAAAVALGTRKLGYVVTPVKVQI